MWSLKADPSLPSDIAKYVLRGNVIDVLLSGRNATPQSGIAMRWIVWRRLASLDEFQNYRASRGKTISASHTFGLGNELDTYSPYGLLEAAWVEGSHPALITQIARYFCPKEMHVVDAVDMMQAIVRTREIDVLRALRCINWRIGDRVRLRQQAITMRFYEGARVLARRRQCPKCS